MVEIEEEPVNAVFLYMGILDAYETVGKELIGDNVVEDHVLHRMIYYVNNFLPEKLEGKSEDEQIDELRKFLDDFKAQVEDLRETGEAKGVTMDEVWELRAAIFGFESVFLDILGEQVIKDYVFQRIADILSFYLPDAFRDMEKSLEEKLQLFAEYIKDHGFVKTARYEMRDDEIEFIANKCAFARIHDSDAYLEDTRFCPWGMIANSIVSAHFDREVGIKDCTFTTRGSLTELPVIQE